MLADKGRLPRMCHALYLAHTLFKPLIYHSVLNNMHISYMGFLSGSVVKNLLANAKDMGSILGSGRSSEEKNGNSLQDLA